MTKVSDLDDAEFAALRRLSARLGANPLLVQGPGGNTSIKENGTLWIKASGKWLAHAENDELFVPVALQPLLEAIANNYPEAEKAEKFVIQSPRAPQLRPSIETVVHALMPQRIVLHVHCVETISQAVLTNAQTVIAERMKGLNYAFIPYSRPGLPLAKAIAERLKPGTDILILGNHGLVVAAARVADAQVLLARVSQLLCRTPRSVPEADEAALQRLALASPYRFPANSRAHAAATDLVSCRIAATGSLYPDHVVFLGAGSWIAGPKDTAASIVENSLRSKSQPPVSILFPGKGVLMRQDAGAGADAMAQCLADVCSRIDAPSRVRYLNVREHGELLNWDAEKYRQELSRRDGAALQ